jgi:uncharacterized membrane protein YqjE
MFKNLINTLINYIETKVEIYKIQFKEEAAKALTVIILVLLFGLMGLLFILFLSFFVVEIINNFMGENYYGYLFVAIFYVIMGLITYLVRGKIREEIAQAIFSEEEENQSIK